MSEASEAVANSISFEAKKDSSKQLQSGHWTLTLKLHPDQVSQSLMMAAPGQRFMCVLVALGDDEQAIPPEHTPTTNAPAEKPKRSWDDMPPAQQAGILVNDLKFQEWMRGRYHAPGVSADKSVKMFCGVQSKTELAEGDPLRQWNLLVDQYRADTRETAEIRS